MRRDKEIQNSNLKFYSLEEFVITMGAVNINSVNSLILSIILYGFEV